MSKSSIMQAGEASAEQKLPRLRRVVTGHDDAGRSVVLIDGPCIFHGDIGGGGWNVQDIWESDVVPVPIEANEPDPTDGPVHFGIPEAGVRVRVTDIPPTAPGTEAFMHRTNSIDYLHVLEGEITMLLDDEEHVVVLRKGDTIVQRATNHAWVNRTDRHCRGLLYQLTGDPEVKAMGLKKVRVGRVETVMPASDADVAILRRKASDFLKAYRDADAGAIGYGPQERLPESMGLVVGGAIKEDALDLMVEEMALDPWARSLEWQATPDPKRLENFSVTIIGAGMGGLNAAVQLKRAGAVIGTGCTGYQLIPEIALEASHVTVFQRTPNYSMPARNAPLDPDFIAEIKANYAEIWQKARSSRGGMPFPAPTENFDEVDESEACRRYEAAWERGGVRVLQQFKDVYSNPKSNEFAANFFRNKIRETVNDPAIAEKLAPKGYPIGAKRAVLDTHYFETFNLPHVHLVDVKETPITKITPTGIRVGDADFPLDVIILATGYDAVTGSFLAIDFRGRDGIRLADRGQPGTWTIRTGGSCPGGRAR